MVYGYCRISSKKQSIERQVRNIGNEFQDAVIIEEVFTGTKTYERKKLQQLLKKVKSGDTIVFDSVSRMSRDAEEGFRLYEELYNKGINLVFLKEPYINTDTYKNTLASSVPLTGTEVDFILEGVNKYLMALAKEQVKLAFLQSEKEVQDLRQRKREGLITAKLNGKQVGCVKGTKLTTKKSIEAKKQILKYSKDFDGTLKDVEVIKLIGISRNSYYKYKKEMVMDMAHQ